MPLNLNLNLVTCRLNGGDAPINTRNKSSDTLIAEMYGSWAEKTKTLYHDQIDYIVESRLANIPFARATHYHFANDGDDSNPGTIAEPKRTLAACSTLLSAHGAGGNVRFSFKEGDIWRENVSLYIGANITIDTYGDPVPYGARWTHFLHQWPQGTSWTLHGGTTWKIVGITQIAWVGYDWAKGGLTIHPDYSLWRKTSAADCMAQVGSFAWVNTDGGTLYVNLGNQDPTDWDLHGTVGVAGNSYAVEIADTNTRMKRITMTGMGLHANGVVLPTYGLAVTANSADGLKEVVLEEVCVTESGYHCIGHLRKSILTMSNCSAGYGRANSANGCTSVVTYTDTGGQETYIVDHTTLAGNLWDGATTNVDTAIYGHTGASGNINLVVVKNHNIMVHRMMSRFPTYIANLPDASGVSGDLGNVRGVIINETMEADALSASTWVEVTMAPNDQVHINCVYRGWNKPSGQLNFGQMGDGWAINTVYHAISRSGYATMCRTVTDGGHLLNCLLRWDSYGAMFDTGNNANAWPNIEIRNCVLECFNEDGAINQNVLNLSTASTTMDYNAIYCVNPVQAQSQLSPSGTAGVGTIAGTHNVMLAAMYPSAYFESYASHPRTRSGGVDLGLEYDIHMDPRDPAVRSIGPVAAQALSTWTYTDSKAIVNVLEPGNLYTDISATTKASRDGTQKAAVWVAAVGTNYQQSTSANRPLVYSNGIAGNGATAWLDAVSPLTLTNHTVYAATGRGAANQNVFVLATNPGSGVSDCVCDYSDSKTYVIGSGSIRSAGYTGTGDVLRKWDLDGAVNITSHRGGGEINSEALSPTGAISLTGNTLLARTTADGTHTSGRLEGMWIVSAPSTFRNSYDEAQLLEKIYQLTGRILHL